MYENKKQPLATAPIFYRRIATNLLVALGFITICLVIGVAGYYITSPGISILDAFHNASMILSGMGPVITITSTSGKLFSSFYALFSGVAFITNIGILLLPVLHRLLHRLHLQEE